MRIGRMMMVAGLGAFLATGFPARPDAHAASGAAFDGSTLAGTWDFHFEGTPFANTFATPVAAFGWFTIEVSSDPNVLNVTGGKAWINVGGYSVDRGSNFEFVINNAGTLRLRDANVGVYGNLDSDPVSGDPIVMAGTGSGGNFLLQYCHIRLDDRRGQSGRMTGRFSFTDPSLYGISTVSGTVTKQ